MANRRLAARREPGKPRISTAATNAATTGRARTHGERKAIMVKLPPEVIAQIDKLRRSRRLKTTRQTWLPEAIFEKFDKEYIGRKR